MVSSEYDRCLVGDSFQEALGTGPAVLPQVPLQRR
jgi:hypothetical protein